MAIGLARYLRRQYDSIIARRLQFTIRSIPLATAIAFGAVTSRSVDIFAQETSKQKQPAKDVPAESPIPELPRGSDPTYDGTPLSPNNRTSLETAIRELFDAGWNSKLSTIDGARQHYLTAATAAPDDPRPGYALGLVLLKHNKYDDALKQFDTVNSGRTRQYIPALRAAVWLRVLTKSYDPATLGLVQFTRAWRDNPSKPPPDWVQAELVIWTGRIAGYLDGIVDNRTVDALVDKSVAEILPMLSHDQQELLKSASQDVCEQYAAKANAQERARIEAKRLQQLEADESKSRLALEASDTLQEKKQVAKDSAELEQKLNEQLTRIDSQIGTLMRQLDQIDGRMRNIATYVQSLDIEIANLAAQRAQFAAESRANGGSTKSGVPITNNSQLGLALVIEQRDRDRLRYQAEYDRLEIQGRDIQRQGAGLVNRRQSLINEYQNASGRLYKEKESIAAKEKFLERKKQELSKPATGSTGQVKAMGQTVKALRTYVDLNLDLEKQRLLDSFEPNDR